MSQTVDFLHKCGVFYLATEDNGKPQVRPINSVLAFDGKVYFETSSNKKMYHQMQKNNHVAISGMAEGKWIRISGKTVFDHNEKVIDTMFETIPSLKDVYTREEFEVYYLENMKSVVYSFTESEIELVD